ncbi:hypothetical protein [Commensalibacter communis]|uniref:hypothetical protein n=1 Tax=Commensalibacter communis TaxID=2972786 RepID=UPI0022FF6554|nr:hypothetical protein [Commensalibacter communis]CAI3922965.1 unnamed protein product [Commensalibacter communis]CAI3931728.1 unnamed protein product [Commensalibacter communis]
MDYYIDEASYINEKRALKPIHLGTIKNKNGANIPLGLFCNDSCAWLSAIIYNPCATWSKIIALSQDPSSIRHFNVLSYNPNDINPHRKVVNQNNYSESLLDGLRVYHNPFATYPLDHGIFRHKDVYQSYCKYQNNTLNWQEECADGFLLFRKAICGIIDRTDSR